MTEQAISANWNAEPPQLGMQALLRLAIWGGVATFALFVAAISAFFSSPGSHRQTAAPAGQTTTVQGSPAQGAAQPGTFAGDFAPRSSETAEETRRLAEAVRALAADRDQALSRIAALEHNLDGVTGSINPTSPPAAAPPPPSPPAAVNVKPVARTESPAAPLTDAATTPTPAPASQQSGPGATPMAASDPGDQAAAPNRVRVSVPAEFVAGAAGLGVDVGGAISYEGLRTLWRSTKNSDPALLEDLFPVVALRENGKTHGAELRLVVGPIADPEGAARLCTTLAAAHHYCQPVAFEGQRLSLADAAPAKTPTAAPHHSASNPPALRTAPPAPLPRAER
jgi:hypothetical protein